jgi:hypothetical protein
MNSATPYATRTLAYIICQIINLKTQHKNKQLYFTNYVTAT